MKGEVKHYVFGVWEYECTCNSVSYANGYDSLNTNVDYYSFYDKEFYEYVEEGEEVCPEDERTYFLHEIDGEDCDAIDNIKDIDFYGFNPWWVKDCRVNKNNKAYFIKEDVVCFYLDLYKEKGNTCNIFILNVLVVDKSEVDTVTTTTLNKFMGKE